MGENKLQKEHFFKNGHIEFRANYNERGELHGVCTKWYDNRNLHFITKYKNGKVNGVETLFYRNGQICSRKEYVDDSLTGLILTFYDDGSNECKCILKDGKYDGYFEEWYKNGQLKARCVLDEPLQEFDVNGNLLHKEHTDILIFEKYFGVIFNEHN